MATKLLIADHDPVNLEVIREHFAETGYELFLCRDGNAAWEALAVADSHFELIILDREIPGLNGISLLKRVKTTPRLAPVPVIMQTVASSPEQLREGLRAGAYCYLTKPYERDTLLSITRAALSDAVNNAALHKRLGEHEDTLQLIRSATFEVRTIDDASRLAVYLAQVSPDPDSAILGLSELLINAIEHGNLGITYAEKSALKRLDGWRDEVQRRSVLAENRNKRVRVDLWRESEGLSIRIRDDGSGFDWKRYLDFDPARAFDLNGRGIALARSGSFDALTYEGCGNSVVATIFNRKPAD